VVTGHVAAGCHHDAAAPRDVDPVVERVILRCLAKDPADRPALETLVADVTARLAQADAVIYEIAISYSGRTYAEGKKITWRDGLAAFWHIVRFNLAKPARPTS
jgi:hypothetical protein